MPRAAILIAFLASQRNPGTPNSKDVSMFLHRNAFPAEADAFHLNPESLFLGDLPLKTNLAAGSHHALPGQRVAGFAQDLHYLPVIKRIAGCGCNLAVGGYLPSRNLPDHLSNSLVAFLGLGRPHQPARNLMLAHNKSLRRGAGTCLPSRHATSPAGSWLPRSFQAPPQEPAFAIWLVVSSGTQLAGEGHVTAGDPGNSLTRRSPAGAQRRRDPALHHDLV